MEYSDNLKQIHIAIPVTTFQKFVNVINLDIGLTRASDRLILAIVSETLNSTRGPPHGWIKGRELLC